MAAILNLTFYQMSWDIGWLELRNKARLTLGDSPSQWVNVHVWLPSWIFSGHLEKNVWCSRATTAGCN
jgi:hypothetical protein